MSEAAFVGVGVIVYVLAMLYCMYEAIKNDGPQAEFTDRHAIFMIAFLIMFGFAFLVVFHGL